MGYTNYWQCDSNLSEYAFSAAVNDFITILPKLDVSLAGSLGNGKPSLSTDEIIFNGSEGLVCEDFSFYRSQSSRRGRDKAFGYCKTENLPYDLCVKVALIILKHYLNNSISISSDGEDTEWDNARENCQKYLGYGNDFRTQKIE